MDGEKREDTEMTCVYYKISYFVQISYQEAGKEFSFLRAIAYQLLIYQKANPRWDVDPDL